MKRPLILLLATVVLAVSAGFFVYPNFPAPADFLSKYLPWRLGLDLIGGAHLVFEADMSGIKEADYKSVLGGLRDIIERRINYFGVSEPNVMTAEVNGSYRIIVELAGEKNIQEAINQIGRVAFLNFREVETVQGEGEQKDRPNFNFILTELTGRHLVKAQAVQSDLGQPQIAIAFSEEGKKIFEELTAKNVGKPLAIFIDNDLISMPRVNEKIIGGNAVITGISSKEEAIDLVNQLNAGALPTPIKLISQQLVGASLGKESLNRAVFAGLVGVLAIIVFMLAYYRNFGFFAALALLIYVVLTLAVFKVFSITMSLAGIAGFILSVGMAVDANILIFERTNEEIKKGISKISAIEEGFKRAWPSIRDSNITTIISAAILFYSTTSFVQGFALTLIIGVLVSMFSAITATRAMLKVFVRK